MNNQQQKWFYLIILSIVWGSSFILIKKASIGLTLVISKKREIGIPPKVPSPFIIPDIIPAEILVGKLLIFLLEYPCNCKITKNIIITQIERCVILGDKNFNR